ncbi:MAG: NADH-quinone oxidoreductase subunit J [Candidatus Diapherotrites archaeon]|nr:NADH-quinone oxidoreductase subunit J [Candidatus Diapherotrites archaeon]
MPFNELSLAVNIAAIAFGVIFAFLAVRARDLVKAALFFALASACIAAVFYLLNSPFAAVLELTVCAGLITVILLVALSLTDEKEKRDE